VTLGVNGAHPSNAGERLTPMEFHEALLSASEDDVVVIDTRNVYESKIGYFCKVRSFCPSTVLHAMRVLKSFKRMLQG
jgi:predicted sulfurtransferase